MELFKKVLIYLFCLLSSQLRADPSHALFMMHHGEPSEAIDRYFEEYKRSGEHDYPLLQALSLKLLEKGWHSKDVESQILALLGAGISGQARALDILKNALNGKNPELQLLALNLLAKQQDDQAHEAIKQALGSPYLIIRLEALLYLAENKDPNAYEQAESLMSKIPKEAKPVFAKIFALLDEPRATTALRKLLNDPSEKVRLETILSIGEMGRDDLLPQVRRAATHMNNPQKEACATVLGQLRDTVSLPILRKLARSPSKHVQLAAWKSLYRLGELNAKDPLIEAAEEGNVFAIAALGEIEGAEENLARLARSPDLQIRINAAVSLLERKDHRCFPALFEVLIEDSRGMVYVKSLSPGSSLAALKAVPSGIERLNGDSSAFELFYRMREAVLKKLVELPERQFLETAELLIRSNRSDLLPTLVGLLEQLHTPRAIAMLKKYQQKIGSPLLRNYCTLSLYRMQEDPAYEQQLQSLIAKQQQGELIRLRPLVPLELREKRTPHQIYPEEQSRFLIEALESLTNAQDKNGVETLLWAIRYGNKKNRYALAGLLARAIQ